MVFRMGNTRTYGQKPLARLGAVQVLALIAMFFHIASPLALQLAGPSVDGLMQTVICSGGVAKTVYIDEDGNPVEPATPGSTAHDCKSCVHHCGAAALTALFALPAPQWTLPAPLRAAYAALSGYAYSSQHSRAPPA
ncbi:MAG TPA: hypothetical protein DCF73_16995 [Rhodobiaceae bacterium]|nr:hypothetical protein [Rhodobiaceae bacterium]